MTFVGASLVDSEALVTVVTSVAVSVTLTVDAVVAVNVHSCSRSVRLDISERIVENVLKMLSMSPPTASSLLVLLLSSSTKSAATIQSFHLFSFKTS